MDFSYELIEPRDITRPDTLVLYPMPVFANIQNTGSRLQKTADLSGVPIVASDLFLQNKKTIFDMAAKKANQPMGETYVGMSRRRSDFFGAVSERYGATTRVGFADSLAVAALQGMHLHHEFGNLFNAVLLRDGWNLGRPTDVVSGIARYLGYQVKDIANQKLTHRNFDIPETPYDDVPKEPGEVGFFGVLNNVSDVMRGAHNRDNAVALAALPRLAMRVVCLDHGLSGSNKKQRLFLDELRDTRSRSTVSGLPIKLSATLEPGWHSDLLDPVRASVNLSEALALLD